MAKQTIKIYTANHPDANIVAEASVYGDYAVHKELAWLTSNYGRYLSGETAAPYGFTAKWGPQWGVTHVSSGWPVQTNLRYREAVTLAKLLEPLGLPTCAFGAPPDAEEMAKLREIVVEFRASRVADHA